LFVNPSKKSGSSYGHDVTCVYFLPTFLSFVSVVIRGGETIKELRMLLLSQRDQPPCFLSHRHGAKWHFCLPLHAGTVRKKRILVGHRRPTDLPRTDQIGPDRSALPPCTLHDKRCPVKLKIGPDSMTLSESCGSKIGSTRTAYAWLKEQDSGQGDNWGVVGLRGSPCYGRGAMEPAAVTSVITQRIGSSLQDDARVTLPC